MTIESSLSADVFRPSSDEMPHLREGGQLAAELLATLCAGGNSPLFDDFAIDREA
ncbi:hypothetical protein [Bradyrhizobium monzae]|uniref:hypothetical protein n=1 Tax=Bradyrhizobium sp. Oc8 TaxID=2876780 RepID=UPI001F316872|nr:hypothetical protein [Bradyrhizobium sp. Oc8]